jgi:prepilin-type N-terminal cleavage/methylation domain-containing protein
MKKNGFTLVELMIYMAISAVIMLAVYSVVMMAMRTSSSLGRKIITQQDARLVLDMMAMDIRNASYNSLHRPGMWRNQNNQILPFNDVTNIDGNGLYGIQVANQSNILVEMNLNDNDFVCGPNSGSCDPNDPNEVISYSYDGVDTITRSSNFGPNLSFFGGVGTGTLVRNNDAGVPLFQYFNGIGTDITAAVVNNPAVIPAIRRIRITIVADTELNDLNTNAPKRMTYTTDVMVKNHALAVYTGGN